MLRWDGWLCPLTIYLFDMFGSCDKLPAGDSLVWFKTVQCCITPACSASIGLNPLLFKGSFINSINSKALIMFFTARQGCCIAEISCLNSHRSTLKSSSLNWFQTVVKWLNQSTSFGEKTVEPEVRVKSWKKTGRYCSKLVNHGNRGSFIRTEQCFLCD